MLAQGLFQHRAVTVGCRDLLAKIFSEFCIGK
jgi:tRNA U34 5-carboxymethylaminomethyl modifying GTPase MnmE/TrmE